MGWFNKKFQLKNSPIEEKDLKEVKELNTVARSGLIYSQPSFSSFFNPSDENENTFKNNENAYIWNLICEIRNWHFSKFNYENLPEGLEKNVLENQLLIHGRVCIFEFAGEFRAYPFRVDKFNSNGKPKKITAYSLWQDTFEKPLTVDKDCVIIYANNDGLIFTINHQPFFGPMWRVWQLILDVADAKN